MMSWWVLAPVPGLHLYAFPRCIYTRQTLHLYAFPRCKRCIYTRFQGFWPFPFMRRPHKEPIHHCLRRLWGKSLLGCSTPSSPHHAFFLRCFPSRWFVWFLLLLWCSCTYLRPSPPLLTYTHTFSTFRSCCNDYSGWLLSICAVWTHTHLGLG
jgi:hypothetical protein